MRARAAAGERRRRRLQLGQDVRPEEVKQVDGLVGLRRAQLRVAAAHRQRDHDEDGGVLRLPSIPRVRRVLLEPRRLAPYVPELLQALKGWVQPWQMAP